MDFLDVKVKSNSKGLVEIIPDFLVQKSKDLMIRGNNFYAVWDEENKVWSTDEYRCIYLIDQEIRKVADELKSSPTVSVKYLKNSSSTSMNRWKEYIHKLSTDNFVPLDKSLVFSNTEPKRELYSSHSLPYALAPGDISAYDELVSVLYSPEERDKLEWIIGSVVTGESKKLQKFIVLTGDAGTGKSTVIRIIRKLFDGYCSVIDAKALGNPNAAFPLESLKNNPLVAYQDDADLSKIKDNTKLNSLISHEPLEVNEKYAKKYQMVFSCILILGSNEEVMISDARSGIQRRLIDVRPTGKKVSFKRYNKLMKQIEFELGAIAWHCKEVYEKDPEKYLNYRPSKAIRATNYTYNFLEENYFEFKEGVTLKRIWTDYKQYCEDAGIPYKLNRIELKREVSAYFKEFVEDTVVDGKRVRSYFREIKPEKFGFAPDVVPDATDNDIPEWLQLKEQHSLLDDVFKDFPAQYAKLKDGSEIPLMSWDKVKTTLKDIDTSKVHYVLPDSIYIEFDLDLRNENGEKDLKKNIQAVLDLGLIPTYVETSKGGQGLHLIYIYTGDVSNLAFLYDENVEIKVHIGKASMRRRVALCNNVPIATITSGLPLKGGKKMVDKVSFASEQHLRRMIFKNLRKEILPHTVESIGLIDKDLTRAFEQGLQYDVRDLRGPILDFAMKSTNSSAKCIKIVNNMKFCSELSTKVIFDDDKGLVRELVVKPNQDNPVIFDVEVYKNLFVFCYAFVNNPEAVTKLINPDPETVKKIFDYYIGGFNNRRYDNHICYARMLGYSNMALYKLSKKIIDGERSSGFGPAYSISDFDIWDIASNKQGLKHWEIELGQKWEHEHPGEKSPFDHVEMSISWDEEVPEDLWDTVADYCANDVKATIAVYNAIQPDIKCRKILAELSGLSIMNTNREHITKILVGDDVNPQHVYTDLATGEQFPNDIKGIYKPGEIINAFYGYEYVDGKNMYRGTDVGKGGYVYAKPGMYTNVALLDVGNMHGASILALNKFGVHTQNYKDIRDARMAIKHHDYETAGKLFGGKLKKYLGSDEEADQLQNALKLVLNSTYGIAAATFDNPLRDKRDVNNIIALRGALFMRTLQDEVTNRGFTVAHIKTDSIKIPNATPEIIQFVMEFGEKYGYEFEHEATYAKMCLVNGSTYIAKYDEQGIRNKRGKHANEWTATAAQFQIPYVFKTLFSHEPLEFSDFCETKSVKQGALYLDFNENLPEGEHDYKFIGRVGRFCPVKPGVNGGVLYRVKDDKYYAATGSKGYRWMDAAYIKDFDYKHMIDRSYYDKQVDEAVFDISKYGDFTWFVSEGNEPMPEDYKFDDVPCDPIEGMMNKPEVEVPF